MLKSVKNVPVLAYFYPLSTRCPHRQARARDHGYKLVDETQLCQDAQPLFEGHAQPVAYCLKEAIHNWDDTDPKALAMQINLALQHGIDGFIFDTYIGQKDGKTVHEMEDVLNKGFLGAENCESMKFAVMAVLGGPRVALPVYPGRAFKEKNRGFDRSRGTIEAIVDACAVQYWWRDNYLRMGRDKKPYISVYITKQRAAGDGVGCDELTVANMIEYLRKYSNQKYRIDPYIVGVLKSPDENVYFEHSVDAMTGYAFLPDFGPDDDPLQDHSLLWMQRQAEWEGIAGSSKQPYVPPVVVGWDASPRGIRGLSLKEVMGLYPFTPIVTGSTPVVFKRMLRDQYEFITQHVPREERYVLITAWNEITEGTALLPRVRPDGSLDNSYLDILSGFIRTSLTNASN